MLHHVLGPHFLGAPIFPGVPNFLLLVALGFACWYFLRRGKDSVTEPGFSDAPRTKPDEGDSLRDEVERLRKENALLQKLLDRELNKK